MSQLRFLLLSTFFLICISSFAQQKYEWPFQDPSLKTEDRVHDLISRLTLKEKVSQLFNKSSPIDRLGIPAYNWWNESLHGVARAGKATVFPQAIGLAATFDENMMHRLASSVSDEARAKHHYFIRNNARSIYMGLTFWTPNINIFRDPRWGRGQETYGEDPYLTARMAVNFIKGLQGDDPTYFKTIATAKHYAVHSGPEFSRHIDNVFVNDRDLYETYLPAFKAAVKEGNVQSVMCAYNRFRDKPCCGSDLLLSSILRNEFGFNGYVVSDCGAITDFYSKGYHEIVKTPSQALGWSLAAGTDLNCEGSKAFIQNLDSAVHAGIVNERDINSSLSRLLTARFKLGMFDADKNVPYAQIPMSVVGSDAHLKLSQEAAEKSLVLLKNDGILPLKKNRRIALIGPNANNLSVLIGNYNGDPIRPVTPLAGLRGRKDIAALYYTPGAPIVPTVYTDFEVVRGENYFHQINDELKKGLVAEYFLDESFSGRPEISRIDSAINFSWERSPITNVLDDPFFVRWSGMFIPKKSGSYIFDGNVSVSIDGKEVKATPINLEGGKQYKFEAKLSVKAFGWTSCYSQQFAILNWTDVSRDYKREALEAAKKSDVIVFCGGISPSLEGEEMDLEIDGFAHGDRTHINLPSVQEDLLKALHALGKPIVFVNFSGSAIALNWEKEHVSAIVQAFYPGEATGTALARVLFGDVNPSGRLPVTFYKSIYDLPDFKNYQMEGRTYRYFKGEPLFEFGYGMSYTSFNYSNLVYPRKVDTGSSFVISVDITNSGKMDGEEVVQVYVSNQTASVPVPLHTLTHFKRIHLKKGETKTVSFTMEAKDFSIIDKDYQRVESAGKYFISVGGRQPGKQSHLYNNVAGAEIEAIGKSYVLED